LNDEVTTSFCAVYVSRLRYEIDEDMCRKFTDVYWDVENILSSGWELNFRGGANPIQSGFFGLLYYSKVGTAESPASALLIGVW
jgi:hypothetical protein